MVGPWWRMYPGVPKRVSPRRACCCKDTATRSRIEPPAGLASGGVGTPFLGWFEHMRAQIAQAHFLVPTAYPVPHVASLPFAAPVVRPAAAASLASERPPRRWACFMCSLCARARARIAPGATAESRA